LPKNTFAFTIYLKSGGREPKQNYSRWRGGEKVKNNCHRLRHLVKTR